MYMTHLECTSCGARFDADRAQTICAECVAPLAARYDLAKIKSEVDRDEIARRRGSLWRLREVLPLSEEHAPITLGEGETPLLPMCRLSAELGVKNLYAKDEGQNPTGSFKARGMTAAVSMAKAFGAKALAVPSAGNAGGALAAYGARAGLPVHLAMPKDVPIANRIEASVCGAEVELIEGTIADCGKWIGARAKDEGWFDLSTLKEPYRVEGKKTMGYELAEHFDWSLPDVVLYPTGGGTGLLGMDKAFDEMRELGWIDAAERSPRMIVVQAAGCAPMVDAFEQKTERFVPQESPHTCASGLRVPTPIGDRWMLDVLKRTNGTAVSVTDEELLEATHEIGRLEGLFAAPEAGALVAALRKCLASGEVRADEKIVLFFTGEGVKYLECFS